MRSLKYMVVALALSASWAQAGGIAVINYQKALDESNAAKVYAKEFEGQFKAQIRELNKLKEQLGLQAQKLDRDGATMSPAERAKIERDLGRKQEIYQFQVRAFQEEKALSDDAEIKRLTPKLNQAIQTVATSGDYDVVLDLSHTRYAKPSTDITGKVIEALNKLTK